MPKATSKPAPVGGYRNLSDDIEAANLKRRVLLMADAFEAPAAQALVVDLTYLAGISKEPIRLIMSSPGGDVFEGLLVYNAIRDVVRQGVKVNVEVYGLCASMAVIVLQAASERIAHRGSRFLIHEVSEFKFFAEATASEKEEQAAELSKVNKSLAEIIAERTGKQPEDILSDIRKRDYWMSASEAKSYGIVDKIV